MRFLLTFCLAEAVSSPVALKKLTTFAFAALLMLAGSAQLSASGGGAAELSPNLYIVPKAQKADKKTRPGFVAFLKRSASGLGQSFVAAVSTRGQNGVKIAKKSPVKRVVSLPAKMHKKSDVRVALPAIGLQPAFFAAMDFHSHGKPAALAKALSDALYVRLFEAKTGSLPPPQGVDQALLLQSVRMAGLKEDYSLLRRLLDLLRPGGALRPERSPHAQQKAVDAGRAALLALPNLADSHSIAPSTADLATAMGKNHLTIDPAQPAALLTHGSMGEGSALRRHRSRDHRSQSV